MKDFTKYFLKKFTATLLLAAILAPSVVKAAHAFSKHEHIVCLEKFDSHFHELDVDCEFYKFNTNQVFTFNNNDFEIPVLQELRIDDMGHYDFLSDYQRLHFSLRGPPRL